MMLRRETPPPLVNQITAGWFRQWHQYSAWRTNGTDDWLLVCTLAGRGRFGFVGGEIVSQPGDLVLLRPGTLHDYGLEPNRNRWELLWAHFHPRPEWHTLLGWPACAPGLMRLSCKDAKELRQIRRRFADFVALSNTAAHRAEDMAMNALEEVLLRCDAINPASRPVAIDSRIRELMDRICQNPAEAHTLASMADLAGLSVSRMAHLFREQTGTTPQQFLEQQRMQHARQLLELTTMSIKAIAAEVGFASAFYFTNRFKKQFGKSPRAFRENRK